MFRFGRLAALVVVISVFGADSAHARAAPVNDDFANAQVIPAGTSATISGDNTGATMEHGEPGAAGDQVDHSVWYRFTPTTAGLYRFSTCGTSVDTIITAFRGSAINELELVTFNDEGGIIDSACSPGGSIIEIEVFAAGATYSLQVVGYTLPDATGLPEGPFTLTMTQSPLPPPPANDDFENPVVVTAGPTYPVYDSRYATTQAGEPAHAGHPAEASLWFSWTPTASKTYTIQCGGFTDPVVAVYTGTSLAALTPVAASEECKVILDAHAGTTYRIAVSGPGFAFNFGIFSVGLTPTPATLTFGDQAVGTLSPRQTVTFVNREASSVELGKPTTAGPNGTDLIITGDSTCVPGLVLEADASCTVSIRFTPETTGARTASLLLPWKDVGSGLSSATSVAVSGMGTQRHDSGADGPKGDTGPAGAAGLPGAVGPAGLQGPKGRPGRDATVRCKPRKKGRKIKVTCRVKYVDPDVARATARLTRSGRTVATHQVRFRRGRALVRFALGSRIRPGTYTVVLTRRAGSAVHTTRTTLRVR